MSVGWCSPEPSRECSSMFLTVESARLPCCTILPRLSRNVSIKSVISARLLSPESRAFRASRNSSINSMETDREIVDEIERIFDLVRDAGGQLAERGKLLGVDKPILRGPQVLQGFGQFVGAGFQLMIYNTQRHIGAFLLGNFLGCDVDAENFASLQP